MESFAYVSRLSSTFNTTIESVEDFSGWIYMSAIISFLSFQKREFLCHWTNQYFSQTVLIPFQKGAAEGGMLSLNK